GVDSGRVAGHAVFVGSGGSVGAEFEARDGAQHAGVVAAHHADADKAHSQISHHAPAFAKVLTASTMRSRPAWSTDGCTGSDRHSRAAAAVSGSSTSTWKGASSWLGIG